MTIRKGDVLTRKCDGYVFRVVSVSRSTRGAHLQCVDATRVFGWYEFDAIEIGFTK